MTKILIASHNSGKIAEILSLLDNLDIKIVLPSQLGLGIDVIENGKTYLENAFKKAQTFADASGLITLADDTGLEVDALDGQPGIFSARYAPNPGATDSDRREHLLKKLRPYTQPWTAYFRCTVTLYNPDGNWNSAEGICPGEIIPDERGHHGFGYDPIFLVKSSGRTMAELTMEEKNRLSHRAMAIRTIYPILHEMQNS